MKQLKGILVELSTPIYTLKGELWGNADLWGFSSQDPYFLQECPSGTLHSFNEYGVSSEWTAFRIFHKAIQAKIKELSAS